jgi:hypothetical protein
LGEPIFALKASDIARTLFTSVSGLAVTVGVLVAVVLSVLLVFHLLGVGWEVFVWLVAVLLLAEAAVLMLLVVPRSGVGYWVEGCRLVVRTGYTRLEVPLDRATVKLVDYAEYEPRWKLAGVSLAGLTYGEFILRNRVRASVVAYQPQKHALLVEADGRVALLSHPGLDRAYRRLLEALESCRRVG